MHADQMVGLYEYRLRVSVSTDIHHVGIEVNSLQNATVTLMILLVESLSTYHCSLTNTCNSIM